MYNNLEYNILYDEYKENVLIFTKIFILLKTIVFDYKFVGNFLI